MPRRFGYLMIDNRASGGGLVELPTYTCAHCNRIVVIRKERTRPRAYCRKCDALVCDPCEAVDCMPMQKTLDLAVKHPDRPWLTPEVDPTEGKVY